MTNLKQDLMLIMQNMVLNNMWEAAMEKVYKLLKNVGGWNIAIGVLLIVIGITLGILNIVSGASLLRNRKNILF